MKESRIQKKILDYLNSLEHSYFFKYQSSIYTPAGIPDVIGVYEGKFFAFEIKNEKGKTSKLQEYVIQQLREAGGEAYVVHSVSEVKQIIKRRG